MADVFVSYSRRDSEFVRRLAESVVARGKEVWVDTEGIADGEVFPEAIKRAIEQSDAFLFVITPASVASAYCEHEVEYARELQKRIVPVLRDAVGDEQLPVEIRERNWIPFTEADEFEASLARLVTALDTDLEAAKAHTRWLVKALEWETERRDRSFLLRGSELKAAEAWLAASPEDADPAPTPLQREYLLASRESAARRQRMLVGASMVIAAISIGLLIFALISRSQAVSEQVSQKASALAADSQAELADDPEISLILGREAVATKVTPATLFALRAGLDSSPLLRAYPDAPGGSECDAAEVAPLAAALSPNGTQIAEGTCHGTLRFIDEANGRVTRSIKVTSTLTALAYSPNGTLLAVGTATGIILVNPHTGAVLASAKASRGGGVQIGGGAGINALVFSPDGRELAATDITGVALWSVPSLRERQFARYPQVGTSLVFTRDGSELLVGGADDNAFDVYALPGGRLLKRVVTGPLGRNGTVGSTLLALSPDGSELAVGYTVDTSDGGVAIFSTRSWRSLYEIAQVHNVAISSLAFSPDGTRLAIGAADGTSGVWSLANQEQVVAYDGPTAEVTSMDFTPGGQTVIVGAGDGTMRLWRALGVEQAFVPLAANVDSIAVSRTLLGVAADVGGKLWFYRFRMPGGQPLGRVLVGPLATSGGSLSDDGRLAVTYAAPNPQTGVPVRSAIHIWNVPKSRIVKTLPPAAVFASAISPDDSRLFLRVQGTGIPNGIGQAEILTLATGHTVPLQTVTPCGYSPAQIVFSANDAEVAGESFCGIVDVWSTRTGRLLQAVNEGGQVSDADLSPNGSLLAVSSWDSRATIYSVASGHQLKTLVGHTRGLNGIAFAGNGGLVVTTSLDDTVRVWNALSGKQLRVLDFGSFQDYLSVSPDGSLVAVGENAQAPGREDVVRVFATCPACQNAKALLRQAAPRIPPEKRWTTLESTVVKEDNSD